MNVTAESSGQSPCAPTISSAPSPFCTVITRRAGEVPREPPRERLEVAALAREDHEVGRRELRRIGGGRRRGAVKSARPGDA